MNSVIEQAERALNVWAEVEKGAREIYLLARDNLETIMSYKAQAENHLCELRHEVEQ